MRRKLWPLAVLAGLLGWQFLSSWTFDPGARAAVDALYATAAYEAASEPGIVDVARARQVVGDRPIVVAVLVPGTDALDRCRDVVARHTEVVAFVYTGPDASGICAGDDFPAPDTSDLSTDLWVELVITDARYSSQFRVEPGRRDHTPQVEEFVLAFDAAVPAHYTDGVPRRELAVSPRVWWEVVARLAGAVAVVVAGFVLLRTVAARALAWRTARTALRERRLAQLVRVGRLADAVLTDPPATDPASARRRAEAAGSYVTVLGEVERADDTGALDATGSRLDELERALLRDRRQGAGRS